MADHETEPASGFDPTPFLLTAVFSGGLILGRLFLPGAWMLLGPVVLLVPLLAVAAVIEMTVPRRGCSDR